MSSSVLLRDCTDQVIGYVLMSNQQLCIRIAGHGMMAETRIGNEDGESTVQVVCNGHEQVFNWETGSEIEWIKVLREGRLIAFGGKLPETDDANRIFAADQPEEVKIATDQPNDSAECAAVTAVHIAQRRWPPPPCWPSAYYVEGAWCEGNV